MEIGLTSIVTITASVLSSGVLAAYISQLYARKNLKTSQYIDVITSERIKWIDTVRRDVSLLASSVMIYMENGDRITSINKPIDIDFLEEIIPEDQISEILAEQKEHKRVIEQELKMLSSRCEIVKMAMLLKLKLNPTEDVEIIHILDNVTKEFSKISCKVDSGIIECDSLIDKCQQMFKREWDKVKEETKKK